MKTEEKEGFEKYLEELEKDNLACKIINAIASIKKTKASWIKEGFLNYKDLLFYDNGNYCEFSQDSCCSFQIIYHGEVLTKKNILDYLETELKKYL